MLQSQFVRFLHQSFPSWSSVSKSHLAKLRKKTGYTFSNCKKALEINDNDLIKAEKWLQEQAQALGWSKLSKLEGRVTAQGLVGLAFEGRKASMVEINCETDFVARNKNFKDMINLASAACLQYAKKTEQPDSISKINLDSENLKNIESSEGKSLADHVALLVSSVGENVSLKRGICVSVDKDLNLECYVHPQTESGNVSNGKYGAIIMYSAPKYNTTTSQIARQLCQHIVGMNPKTIYKKSEDVEEKMVVEDKRLNDAAGDQVNSKERDEEVVEGKEEKEEDAMMMQDFLLDPSVTVEEMLDGSGIKVLDFVRYETGERIQLAVEEVSPKLKASQIGG